MQLSWAQQFTLLYSSAWVCTWSRFSRLFYIAMAVYGWYSWSAESGGDELLHVSRWPLAFHVPGIVLIAILTATSGFLLSEYSDASFPYLDSFTTWGGIVATWLVARKVLENWYYWLLIDSVSLYMYASRGLWLTAALFVLYLVLIVIGYRSWRASLFEMRDAPPSDLQRLAMSRTRSGRSQVYSAPAGGPVSRSWLVDLNGRQAVLRQDREIARCARP